MFFKKVKFPPAWSAGAALQVTREDWEREWPRLLRQIEAGTLRALKRSASGDVWSGEIVLAGRPIEVVIKRPYRRYWYRYVTEIGRGTRAWRGWRKSWMLIARGIPAAWPLAVLEKRKAGVVVDQFLVCEKVRGRQLDQIDLDGLDPQRRQDIFRRVGRILRRIEETGLVHFDTKASNIMIDDEGRPILVDVDGVRGYSWRGEGLRRLLKSLRDHQKQFTDADGQELQLGYAPFRKWRGGPGGAGGAGGRGRGGAS